MIIGSTALRYWFEYFKREPKDLDIVAFDEADQAQLIELHKYVEKRVEVLINPVILNWFKRKIGKVPAYCHKDELYTLKISHAIGWDLKNNTWDKHMWDINFMKENGCKFIPELFNELYTYWNTIHGKNKRSDLEMSSEDFFDNAITFPIRHDDLHDILITHPYFKDQEKPTYSFILKDGAEVDVSEEKFNKLDFQEKCNLVFEEVMVMSIENRFPKELHWRAKYSRMLRKFLLNHAPLWEALFIIQNHKHLSNPPFNHEEFLNQEICKLTLKS